MASPTTSGSEVLETERQYWEATRARDFETMERLTTDSFVLVQGSGIATFSRYEFVDMIRNAGFRLLTFDIDEEAVRYSWPAESVCHVAYRVRSESQQDGAASNISSFNTSLLVKRGEVWQRAAHSISPT
jgi:uncharacterized protein DUF4440